MLPIYDRDGNLKGFIREQQLMAFRAKLVMMTNGAEPALGQVLRVVALPTDENQETLTLEVVS